MPTFTDASKLTWTINDFVMTYPTTYAAFFDFQGAAAATTGYNSSCANEDDLSYLYLPEKTEAASLILPLASVSPYQNPFAVPSPILSYLDGLSTIQQQLSGHHALQCVPTQLLGNCLPNPCSTVCTTDYGKPISTSTRTITYTTVYQPTTSTETFVNAAPISDGNSFGVSYNTYVVTATYGLSTETSLSEVETTFYDNPFNETSTICELTCNSAIGSSSSMTEIGIGHKTASVLTTVTKSAVIQAAPFPVQQAPLQTPTLSLPKQTTGPLQGVPSPTPSVGDRPSPGPPQEVNQGGTSRKSNPQASKPCTELVCILTAVHQTPPNSHGGGAGDNSPVHSTANQAPGAPNNDPPISGNGSPQPAVPPPSSGVVVPAGSTTITAKVAGDGSGGGGTFIFPSTTLTAGQQATLPNGQIVSVDFSGSLEVGGSPVTLQPLPSPTAAGRRPAFTGAVITAGSQTLTASKVAQSVYAIGSTTLSKGQTATLPNGQVIGVDATGGLSVGGSSIPVSFIIPPVTQGAVGAATAPFAGAVFTAGTRALTATEIRPGVYVFDSTTLSAGQAITLSNGLVLSAALSDVVVDGSTVPVSLVTPTSARSSPTSSAGGSSGAQSSYPGGSTASGVPLPALGDAPQLAASHAMGVAVAVFAVVLSSL